VPNGSRVNVYLVVVAALIALVSVEMNFVVLTLDVLEAERFVPACWEYVERYLAAN